MLTSSLQEGALVCLVPQPELWATLQHGLCGCVCIICICVSVHMSAVSYGGQQRAADS